MIKLTLLSDDAGIVRLQCEGQISQSRFQADGNPLENLLGAQSYARKVLLNLENTDYIDSSGISWLIVNHKRFNQAGGRLVLHSLPPRVSQVLQFCKMDTIFHIAVDEKTALGQLQGDKKA
jgi:anti-anti-sigma factor